MFERFTERARQAVVLSQNEARVLKHNYLGTEHLLLGLLLEEEGLAAKVLDSFGITVAQVRAAVVRIVGEGEESVVGQIPFTARAKKVLELALRESLSIGHNYIGTEHLLLGLVRESDGIGARILHGLGAGDGKIRNEILRVLSSPGRPDEPTTVPAADGTTAPIEPIDDATRALTVGELIDAVARVTEAAIEAEDFERAALAHDLERHLNGLLRRVPEAIGSRPAKT